MAVQHDSHAFFFAMKTRPVIDASALPDQGFSHHAPVWWGNTLTMLIEGAGFAILVFTYFYVRRNFDTWPPTGTLVPDLGISTINLVVLVVGILPMWHVAHLAPRHDRPRVLGFWLLVCVLFGIAAAILRLMEFKGVHTRWNSNAYGAILWSILAVHFAHILAATLETLAIGILMFRGPVEEKHFVDISVNAVYWYFVALSWVALYAIVILAPRFM
ncbi:MAG: cytochrome c oxidase subunit 3 [Gemmatimonadota bacterium]|nr:cytochrome c oxidase subunit 3 [Gemmatimonadota bacterium]